MKSLRTLFLTANFLLILSYQNVWSQSHLYFATASEIFWDSSTKVKVRKLTKGECVLVENMELYKKKFLYATCLIDGKAGFIDKNFLKYEKTYFPDSVGNHPLEFARKEYAKPFIRLVNTNKNNSLKITFGPSVYDLKAGQASNFFYKPGLQRYKVVAPGYQPLYDQVVCSPNHITELEFYTE